MQGRDCIGIAPVVFWFHGSNVKELTGRLNQKMSQKKGPLAGPLALAIVVFVAVVVAVFVAVVVFDVFGVTQVDAE